MPVYRLDMHEFEGHLDVHTEQGCGMSVILQDNRGIRPNPDYDPKATTYPQCVPAWHSLSYSVFFRGGEEIEVYNDDGSVEFRGTITRDRKAMSQNNYLFMPKEVTSAKLIQWINEKRKAKVWSQDPPIAEDPMFQGNK
jgi:hypothetical protein